MNLVHYHDVYIIAQRASQTCPPLRCLLFLEQVLVHSPVRFGDAHPGLVNVRILGHQGFGASGIFFNWLLV